MKKEGDEMSNPMAVVPDPNVNGSSLRLLMRQRQAAYEALLGAVEAIEAMEPHPRDFLQHERHEEAVGLHAQRWAKIVGIRDAVLFEYQSLLEIYNNRKTTWQGLIT